MQIWYRKGGAGHANLTIYCRTDLAGLAGLMRADQLCIQKKKGKQSSPSAICNLEQSLEWSGTKAIFCLPTHQLQEVTSTPKNNCYSSWFRQLHQSPTTSGLGSEINWLVCTGIPCKEDSGYLSHGTIKTSKVLQVATNIDDARITFGQSLSSQPNHV